MSGEVVAPWLMLGPRLGGRDYGLLTHSRQFDPAAEPRVLEMVEDFALTTLRARPLGRTWMTLLDLPDTGRFLLTFTRFLGNAAQGPVSATRALLLTRAQLEMLGPHLPELILNLPDPVASPEAWPEPLRWHPPVPAPIERSVTADVAAELVRKNATALMVPANQLPEDPALAIAAVRARLVSITPTFVTRADLEFVGVLAEIPPPRLITFTDGDPPVSSARFTTYLKLRLTAEGELIGAPPGAPARHLWSALLRKAMGIDDVVLRELDAIDPAPGQDAINAVVEAKAAALYEAAARGGANARLNAVSRLASAASALEATDAALAAEAIVNAFQSSRQLPHTAADVIDHYRASVAPHFKFARSGNTENLPAFLAAKALDWNAALLLPEQTAETLAETLTGPLAARFAEALPNMPTEGEASGIYLKALAERGQPVDLPLAFGLLRSALRGGDPAKAPQHTVELGAVIAKNAVGAILPDFVGILIETGRITTAAFGGLLLPLTERIRRERKVWKNKGLDDAERGLLLATVRTLRARSRAGVGWHE